MKDRCALSCTECFRNSCSRRASLRRSCETTFCLSKINAFWVQDSFCEKMQSLRGASRPLKNINRVGGDCAAGGGVHGTSQAEVRSILLKKQPTAPEMYIEIADISGWAKGEGLESSKLFLQIFV
eukprot:Selendium_serpulae@DN6093_c2_g2_i7.p1